MQRGILVWILTVSIILAFTAGKKIQAADLSVERYCELSIARLEFALDLWEREGRGPNTLEEAMLWQWNGTTAEEYYAFASIHRKEVEAYLTAHPDIRTEIERLSARINELIGQAEGR